MPFRPPSFSTVVAFEAAARYESFARAAVELNLTQSAISHAIRALESRVGEQLFERRGRRVALTPGGAHLAQRIRAGLALLAGAFGDAETPDDDAERVVIGAPLEFVSQVLMPRLSASTLLDRCEVRTTLLPGALIDGAADLVVARGPVAWPALAHRLLAKDSVFPVAAPRLAGTAGFPDLHGLPLIENVTHPWRLWLAQVRWPGEPAGVGLVVDDWRMAMEAAKAGAGVCLALSSLARSDLASGRLIRVGSAELTLDEGYHLLWNPRAPRRAAVMSVIELVTGEAALSAERPRARAVEAQSRDDGTDRAARLKLVAPLAPRHA
ncbi:MAG TPA: LysR family transcriptional regulator [Phenylobacterium sp.]